MHFAAIDALAVAIVEMGHTATGMSAVAPLGGATSSAATVMVAVLILWKVSFNQKKKHGWTTSRLLLLVLMYLTQTKMAKSISMNSWVLVVLLHFKSLTLTVTVEFL